MLYFKLIGIKCCVWLEESGDEVREGLMFHFLILKSNGQKKIKIVIILTNVEMMKGNMYMAFILYTL